MVKAVAERLGIVETKVENLDCKMDELKVDVKEMHDCLDKTRDDLKAKLDEMYNASCTQHAELAKKISTVEKEKDRLLKYGMITMAFIAGLGWSGNVNFLTIAKFFGI